MAQILRALVHPKDSPSTNIWQSTTTLIPAPRHPMPSSDLQRHPACMWYTDVHAGKIPKPIK